MHRIFVYGTLKRGFYNHERCDLHTAKATFLGEARLSGMSMTTWGRYGGADIPMPYPAAYVNDGGEITGEIYEVSDEVFTDICGMELGAGYAIKSTESNWGRVIMFFNPRLSADTVPDYAVISTYNEHASDWYVPPKPKKKANKRQSVAVR